MVFERLSEMGIVLPSISTPLAAYIPAVQSGNLVFVSGQIPLREGQLPPEYAGKLGETVSLETGQAAARQATLNGLAALHNLIGLDQVQRIVRIGGFVSSSPSFVSQHLVMNAASELLGAIFGDSGKHARYAVGVAALPLDVCVEIEMIVEVRASGK